MSSGPLVHIALHEQPGGRRLRTLEEGEEVGGGPARMGRELEGGGRERDAQKIGGRVQQESQRSTRERSRRRSRPGSRRRSRPRGVEQFEHEFIKEKEKRKKEKEKEEGQGVQGAGKEGIGKGLRIYRTRPQAQEPQESNEACAKSHEASLEGRQRGLLVHQRGGEFQQWRRGPPVRGDAQDQEGCDEGARRPFGPHHCEHVQGLAHAPGLADRDPGWSSTVRSPPVPQASPVAEVVPAIVQGELESMCCHGRHLEWTGGAGGRHTSPAFEVGRELGRRTVMGGFTEVGVDTSGGSPTCRRRREQDGQQGAARGVEESTSHAENMGEERQGNFEEQAGGGKREDQEGQRRRQGQTQGGTGEREVDSPPPYMTEAEIETELEEMARLASCGAEQTSRVQTDDLLQMQMPYGSGRLYNHSSVAILASTVPDEDAASEGKPTTSPLEERKKELGAGGFRFVDVVGDLTRDLSPFLRKTLTKGEVFPLPYGSSLAGPPFDVLDAEVREVLRGMVLALNSVYDCGPPKKERVSPLHERILFQLSEEAQRFVSKTEKFERLSWQDFLRVRSVDYKGDEVKTAQRTSWAHVAPALPEEVGTVDLEQVVSGGCLHYVRNFTQYLVPEESQVFTKAPKVMIADDEWDCMCEGLMQRGICGAIAESKVHHVQGRPLLNGMFGVLKEETAQGREVHRLIMNLVPLNKLCKGIEGDVSTLPAWPSMSSFFIQPTETLLVSSEDVRCFFYLFRVRREWQPFLAFAKPLPARLCPHNRERFYLTSLVLPMGFCNSVALAQHIHRQVVSSALEEARKEGLQHGWEAELRRDRPLSSANPTYRIYLDNFDQLEKVDSALAERIKGTPAPLVDSLRSVYTDMAIPRHPKKAVERQSSAEVQGALVDGTEGTARPRPEKVMRYVQLTLLLLESGRCSQKQMQIVAGGLVYMAMFRRALLGALNAIWEFIQSFDGLGPHFRPLPQPVRREIARFCLLAPLARMDFRLPFSPTVTASDASTTGGGITASSRLTGMHGRQL